MEVILEVVLELFAELAFRGGRAAVRSGARRPGAVKWVVVGACVAAAAAFGAWRGAVAADRPTIGFWIAVAAIALTTIGLLRQERGAEAPPSRWRRLLTWWPPARLWPFFAANAAFAAAYLVALVR